MNIAGHHLEIERRISPGQPEYAGYSGTDGRDVFLVYCQPPWLSDAAIGRHVPVCADDEEDAKRQALPVFQGMPVSEWGAA